MAWITNTELIIILLGLAVYSKQVSDDSHKVVGTLDISFFDNSSVGMKNDSAIMHFTVNNTARYMQEKATPDVNISSEDGLERLRLGDADNTEKQMISFSNSNSTAAVVDITTTTYYPGTEAIDYLIHDSATNEVRTEAIDYLIHDSTTNEVRTEPIDYLIHDSTTNEVITETIDYLIHDSTTNEVRTEAIDYLIHDSTTNEVRTATNCENTSLLCEEGTYLDTTTSSATGTVMPYYTSFGNAKIEESVPSTPVADDKKLIRPPHTYFNSLVSEYQKVENGSVVFHPVENDSLFPLTYYNCYEMEEKWKSHENIRINCNCNEGNEKHCCTMGLVLFFFEKKIDHWNCSTTTYTGNYYSSIETEYVLINENSQNGYFPYVLLPSNYPCIDCKQEDKWDYVIVTIEEQYNSSTFKVEDKLFEEKYYCRKAPNETGVFLCGVKKKYIEHYEAANIVSSIFNSVTLVVFFLLPDMRTVKTRILICQTVSFLVINLVNLRFYAAGGELQEMECILSGYTNHYFGLAGSFWINVLCIDMAWTFRGVQFQRADRWKFRIYSLYAWGTPLLIAILTASLEFSTVGEGSTWKPKLSMANCWFDTLLAMKIFHYGTYLVHTLINGPLLTFVIFKISRALCASAVLENNDSGRHTGSKATKKKTRRFVIYTNLALLIGAAHWRSPNTDLHQTDDREREADANN